MELPRRARNDELLPPGEFTHIRARLRKLAPAHDLATVIAYAFDRRTRLLPFVMADRRLAPAGVRALGAAMADAGFPKTRVVLQQWNGSFQPSEMRLDGRVPDIFMVSSMALHEAPCRKLIADACRIDPAYRPLIVVGGPKSVYQPWRDFRVAPDDPEGPDLAVTGEEYVWLSVLERLLMERANGEALARTFRRARDRGLLDDIPGLFFAHTDRHGVAQEFVDTGVQRLLGDLDELPHPKIGYGLLERPSRARTLASQPLPPREVRRYSPISSLVLTFGCKFQCSYCPIPAYNQRQYRVKSPGRIADEMATLHREYGLRLFFGTDDNFFNDHNRAIQIAETLSRTAGDDGHPLRKRIFWATEATVHDTLQLRDHMLTFRGAGMRALWLGVEDMTGTLVKKGQSVDRTTEAFAALREHGIHPMPMMMHHDGQPLYTRGKPYGLLNQMQILRNAGAVTVQVLMLTPGIGSRTYDEAFTNGSAIERACGRDVEPHMTDGAYVIASLDKRPWRLQLNLLAAYLFFYNPLRLLKALLPSKDRLWRGDAICQLLGMRGLLATMRRTLPWALRMWFGRIVRHTSPPGTRVPVRSTQDVRASLVPARDASATRRLVCPRNGRMAEVSVRALRVESCDLFDNPAQVDCGQDCIR